MYPPVKKGDAAQIRKNKYQPFQGLKDPHQGLSKKLKEEKFDKEFSHIAEALLHLKLDNPDFDEIDIETLRGKGLSKEDCLNLLNVKFHKLIEILQYEERDVKILEEQDEKLKNISTEKRARSHGLLEKARQQLQEQLERHGQLSQESETGTHKSQNLQRELQAKEEAILQLNKNIQQLMTDFVTARDRNDKVEDKLRRVKEGKKAEDEELKGPRPGSPEYEEKMNRIWAIERNLKEEEEIQRSLENENEQLKNQLKELAPHSVLSPGDKSPKDMSSLIDLEKYADMRPEDIHREIESLKVQASKQHEIIGRLEDKNKEDIDAINIQKTRIEELRAQYVENMDRFYKVKQEREDSAARCEKIEEEISDLLQNYNSLSTLLGKGAATTGIGHSSHREIGGSYKSEIQKSPITKKYYSVGGYDRQTEQDIRKIGKEVSIPSPSKLNVRPSKGETKENIGWNS